MITITQELLADAYADINAIKTPEQIDIFLDNYHDSQPNFLAFINGSFKKLFSESTFVHLIHSTGHFFYVIKKSNPLLSELTKEHISEVFDENMKVGTYIQKSGNVEETLLFIVENHKYPLLMKRAFDYYRVFLLDNPKEISVLAFIILKMLVEACDKSLA